MTPTDPSQPVGNRRKFVDTLSKCGNPILITYRSELIVAVVFLASILFSSSSWGELESLESIAKNDPNREVLLQVSFLRIQRSPAIVDLLRDSSLGLEWVKGKNVGSGGSEGGLGCGTSVGPPIADTPELIAEVLACQESERNEFFRRRAEFEGTYRDIDCPVDDYSAPTKDTHGIPGDYSVEAACGLRIVAIRIRGSAENAVQFTQVHEDIAAFVRVPSPDELIRMREELLKKQAQAEPD